jgi:hypothetical protein
MTTNAKTVNYTKEQTDDLKARYAAGESVADLAKALGKTTRSIVAKLSREGVYKAKEYVSKTGEKPAKKSDIVQRISELANIPIDQCDSLEKVNKQLLVNLIAALKRE